jgi:hypothetical protein
MRKLEALSTKAEEKRAFFLSEISSRSSSGFQAAGFR